MVAAFADENESVKSIAVATKPTKSFEAMLDV
jgi:hypothetical protein